MDAGASIQQAGSGFFGNSAPFGQSGESFLSNSSLIQSSVFPTVTSASSQSGLFGPGNATNQSGLFGQNSVSTGLTGSVFANNASSTNQTMTGISSSFPATNQSGALFGTKPDQSAASSGLFSAKPELKPGLFASSSSTTSSGLFSGGPQLQKDSATISASPIAPNSSIVSGFIFIHPLSVLHTLYIAAIVRNASPDIIFRHAKQTRIEINQSQPTDLLNLRLISKEVTLNKHWLVIGVF